MIKVKTMREILEKDWKMTLEEATRHPIAMIRNRAICELIWEKI